MAGEDQESRLPVVVVKGNPSTQRVITIREWFTVFVLCYVNLINYMDRFTIAGKISFKIRFPGAEKVRSDPFFLNNNNHYY